jgi:hypothetical protein
MPIVYVVSGREAFIILAWVLRQSDLDALYSGRGQ